MMDLQDIVLMKWPSDLVGKPGYVRDGAIIRNADNGQVGGHMVEAFRGRVPRFPGLPSLCGVVNVGLSLLTFAYMSKQFNSLNRRIDSLESSVKKVDEKIDAVIGLVSELGNKVDAVGDDLTALAGKIDSRHRDMAFAEIGALLDTLAYADRKSQSEAQSLVSQNLTPARKAIRIFNSLMEEYEAAAEESFLGTLEVIRMRLLSGILSVKIDVAIGELESACDRSAELTKEIGDKLSYSFWRWAISGSEFEITDQEDLHSFAEAFEAVTGKDKSEFYTRLIKKMKFKRDIEITKEQAFYTQLLSKLLKITASSFKTMLNNGKVDGQSLFERISKFSEWCNSQGPAEVYCSSAIAPKLDACRSMASLMSIARGIELEVNLQAVDPEAIGKFKAVANKPFEEQFLILLPGDSPNSVFAAI